MKRITWECCGKKYSGPHARRDATAHANRMRKAGKQFTGLKRRTIYRSKDKLHAYVRNSFVDV